MPIPTDHAGRALTGMLISHGVEAVFGVPGGQTAALYDGIASLGDRIRHVPVRDERTAAYAADAYARVTGRVGVCDATVGPGTAKLPSGLGEAYNSSIPVLALVSDLPTSTATRRNRGATSQALAQEELLAPVTKWVGTVRKVEDLAPLTRRAFREATTGRAGPVALILAQDVLDGPPPESEPDPLAARFATYPSLRTAPEPGAAEIIAGRLAAAERPLLVLGGGVLISGAGPAAVRLAEAAGCGVTTTLSGKGSIGEGHRLALGVLGTLGTTAANEIAHAADLLVLVGCKMGSGTSLGWKLPLRGQEVVQIDVDPAELGRDAPVSAVMLADARLGIEAILEAWQNDDLTGRGETSRGDSSVASTWGDEVAGAAGRWRLSRDAERESDARPAKPQRVMGELQASLGPDAVVVADASLSSGWVGAYLETDAGRRTLFPRGLAGLGWALPAAIGAAEAAPGRRVVAVMGDGAAAYAIGELSTLIERQLPITAVVLNNGSLGWIRWYRRISFGRGWEEPDSPPTSFSDVAAAYGLQTWRVEEPSDLAPALDKALGSEGPTLIEVTTETWETPIEAHRRALTDNETAGYGS